MMIGFQARFAELAPAKADLEPAGHEQVATKEADCEWYNSDTVIM